MKIKKIRARDIRTVMRKMKQECGDDAVILINRKTPDGIELIVGVDYNQKALDKLIFQQPDIYPGIATPTSTVKKNAANRTAAYCENVANAKQPSSQTGVERDADTNAVAAKVADQVAITGNRDPLKQISKAEMIKLQEPFMNGVRQELTTINEQIKNQMDYLGWDKFSKELPRHANLLRQLAAIGLGSKLCKKIIRSVNNEANSQKAWQRAFSIWAQHIKVNDDDILKNGGVVALLGLIGVGKTTTAAKLAAQFAKRHGANSVLLVANDNQRIGAHEQLLSLGRMLGISVMSATSNQELCDILHSVSSKKLVLIDSAGIKQNDKYSETENYIFTLKDFNIKKYLVMSCSAQIGSLEKLVQNYMRYDIKGCILTKLDEAVSLGGVLTVVTSYKLPLSYITTGPDVPDDIKPAIISMLLNKAVALSKEQKSKPDEDFLAMRFGKGVMRAAV